MKQIRWLGSSRNELVSHPHPASIGVRVDRIGNVSCEVRFGARWTDRRCFHSSRRDHEVRHQTERPMSLVLEFDSLDQSWPRRLLRCDALQSLLIGRDDVGFELQRRSVEVTHVPHLTGVSLWVRLLRFGIQPVAALVRTEVDLLLKNAPPAAGRYSLQPRV